MRLFALTVPGLGSLLRRELGAAAGAAEHDGRSDVVPFEAGPDEPVEPRLAEDLFVEIGSAPADAPLERVVRRLWSPERFERALPAVAPRVGRTGPGFRVVARLTDERRFLRSELREALARAVLRDRPRWRPADPARLELWALQTAANTIRLGVRISDRAMRQRSGREAELPGALRPVVAAAMVGLAGTPRLRLLDPCCGTGTIVGEALAAGWSAIGSDMDRTALSAARANLPRSVSLVRADAARLPFRSGTMGAVVANLPFGRRHALPFAPERWLRSAMAEFERVVTPGGAIVLLAAPSPEFESAVLGDRRRVLVTRCPIRLLGLPTTIWQFRRADGAGERAR
jgi:SAM-dependent methyltransferase